MATGVFMNINATKRLIGCKQTLVGGRRVCWRISESFNSKGLAYYEYKLDHVTRHHNRVSTPSTHMHESRRRHSMIRNFVH